MVVTKNACKNRTRRNATSLIGTSLQLSCKNEKGPKGAWNEADYVFARKNLIIARSIFAHIFGDPAVRLLHMPPYQYFYEQQDR